jgi:hypothetical protein
MSGRFHDHGRRLRRWSEIDGPEVLQFPAPDDHSASTVWLWVEQGIGVAASGDIDERLAVAVDGFAQAATARRAAASIRCLRSFTSP